MWYRHSITVSTLPARGPQRAAGTCRPFLFHIISHLMNRDGGDSPQPTLTGRMLGICRFLNSWQQQRGEGMVLSRGCHSVERCHWLTRQLRDQGRLHLIHPQYCRAAVHQLAPKLDSWAGNLVCDSCVQPVVSSILKRSIKKRLMVMQRMTAQRGEQGRGNRRAVAYITGIEAPK